MGGQVWRAVQIFAALFYKIPMIEARLVLPSAVLLIAYPVAVALWPEDLALGFAVAFVLCQVARYGQRLGQMTWGKVLAGVLLGAVAVVIGAGQPWVLQHLPSLVSLGFVGLFVIDALNRSYATVRGYWPQVVFAPYAREVTQVMLVLHLTYILLNETMIRVAALDGWLVFYAILPIVHHVLVTALFRTVFWLTPEVGPEMESKRGRGKR